MFNRSVVVLVLVAALAALSLTVFSGCPKAPSGGEIAPPPPPPGPAAGAGGATGKLQIVGSTTVLPIAQAWLKAFGAQHPEVQVAVSGGGSGTGIKQLIGKTTDIANSSREMKQEEIDQAKAAGVDAKGTTIAYDGIAVIVNKDNPLSEISAEMLSDIFIGKITKWDDAGAPGLGAIQAAARDSASGTYESFKEMIVTLGGKDKLRDYAPECLKLASNEAIRETVIKTKSAIGYVGLGYVSDQVKVLGIISLGGGKTAVKPSADTVRDKSYPISRALWVYTAGEPQGAVKAWIDFGLSPEGQKLVEEQGFIPLQ